MKRHPENIEAHGWQAAEAHGGNPLILFGFL